MGWANREEGEGVVGLTVVGLVCLGLVLSYLLISFLILSCWRVERDGETKVSDGSGKRGAWAAVTRGEDQDIDREGLGLVLVGE